MQISLKDLRKDSEDKMNSTQTQLEEIKAVAVKRINQDQLNKELEKLREKIQQEYSGLVTKEVKKITEK